MIDGEAALLAEVQHICKFRPGMTSQRLKILTFIEPGPTSRSKLEIYPSHDTIIVRNVQIRGAFLLQIQGKKGARVMLTKSEDLIQIHFKPTSP